MKYYQAPQTSLWTGRTDPGYWYQQIEMLNLPALARLGSNESGYALLGYACEEGVMRNLGRLGAKSGPGALRQQLGKTAFHHVGKRVFDAGDLVCEGEQMDACQSAYAEGIQHLLQAGYFPIGIGGGHDIAFGTYQGVRAYLNAGQRLGIINIDAHFDLRKPQSQAHSGTPFYQAFERQQALHQSFDYMVLGIQQAANSATLFETAAETGTQYILNETMWQGAEIASLQDFLAPLDAIYLSIDMDAFASAYAPGVSATSPMGLSPRQAMHYLAPILASDKVVALDFAELSPAHDSQSLTAKLTARLLDWIMGRI